MNINRHKKYELLLSIKKITDFRFLQTQTKAQKTLDIKMNS